MTLTREAILAMPAGREMDALIAELVMGWRVEHEPYQFLDGEAGTGYDDPGDFQPSTDIAAAWEVVERLNLLDLYALKRSNEYDSQTAGYEVGEPSCGDGGRYWDRLAEAETAPLAICRAALLTTITP